MKNGGLIVWNATVISEMSETSWQMGILLVKGDSECHFNGPVIPYGAMVEHHPTSAKDKSRLSHQFNK